MTVSLVFYLTSMLPCCAHSSIKLRHMPGIYLLELNQKECM